MSTEPGARRCRRSALIKVGIGFLCVVCCAGALVVLLLAEHFPMSLASPRLRMDQPLGEGQALAFSFMRFDILRPFELYILDDTRGIRPIGSGLIRSDIDPIWSPDGSQLLYASVYGGTPRLYLVDADGEDRREIGPDLGLIFQPRWSPDGARLAYLAVEQQPEGSPLGSTSLYVTGVATGDTARVAEGQFQDFQWLADGQSLLALERADDAIHAEVYGTSGTHQGRLSAMGDMQDAGRISLSPDASKVAYILPAAAGDPQSLTDLLCISALDGSTTWSVDTLWMDGSLIWSPDSEKIAFTSLTDDYYEALYVVDADGTELRELMVLNTGDESGEILPGTPAWSADGTRIAIGSFSDPDGSAIFVMNADGSDRRQVTAIAAGMMYSLAWRPNPSK